MLYKVIVSEAKKNLLEGWTPTCQDMMVTHQSSQHACFEKCQSCHVMLLLLHPACPILAQHLQWTSSLMPLSFLSVPTMISRVADWTLRDAPIFSRKFEYVASIVECLTKWPSLSQAISSWSNVASIASMLAKSETTRSLRTLSLMYLSFCFIPTMISGVPQWGPWTASIFSYTLYSDAPIAKCFVEWLPLRLANSSWSLDSNMSKVDDIAPEYSTFMLWEMWIRSCNVACITSILAKSRTPCLLWTSSSPTLSFWPMPTISGRVVPPVMTSSYSLEQCHLWNLQNCNHLCRPWNHNASEATCVQHVHTCHIELLLGEA